MTFHAGPRQPLPAGRLDGARMRDLGRVLRSIESR